MTAHVLLYFSQAVPDSTAAIKQLWIFAIDRKVRDETNHLEDNRILKPAGLRQHILPIKHHRRATCRIGDR